MGLAKFIKVHYRDFFLPFLFNMGSTRVVSSSQLSHNGMVLRQSLVSASADDLDMKCIQYSIWSDSLDAMYQ